MKKIVGKVLCASVVVGAMFIAINEVSAAEDHLWLPASGNEQMLTAQQYTFVEAAPNEELVRVAAKYDQWLSSIRGNTYNVKIGGDWMELKSSQAAMYKLNDLLDVRVHLYEWSHRYDHYGPGKTKDQMSYANAELRAMQFDIADIKNKELKLNAPHAEVREVVRLKLPTRIYTGAEMLEIEAKHMADVNDSELRHYANEALIFAMENTMKSEIFSTPVKTAKAKN